MKLTGQGFVAILCCEALLFVGVGCSHKLTEPKTPLAPAVFEPLREDLLKSYLTLFEIAPRLEYSEKQIEAMRNYLTLAQNYCTGEFKQQASKYADDAKREEDRLKKMGSKVPENERDNLHCQIQSYRMLQARSNVLASHAIPVAYENKEAKLKLIEQWPGDLKQIKGDLANGSYKNRQWGDVQDIGFREIAPGQKDDIKAGEDSIRQMRQSGMMPPAVTDKAIVDYVTDVAQRVAKHSDLHVPLHVTVLNAKDVNAFALPGGFLFVNRGLLNAADNETELAGVIGHELGHVAARHGHKLMVRAEMASIFYQAAEVAAAIFTGGVATAAAYYALEYGFQGLGLLLNLNLLGVSREYELQADQLGIQYTWASGYDPRGFIQFFDKMATKEGYVDSLSWFYDHPPFYERMKDAMREILFLPKKANLIENTTAFETMKKELAKVKATAKEEAKNRPSLLTPVQGCPAPKQLQYKPGQPIETLCQLPAAKYTSRASK